MIMKPHPRAYRIMITNNYIIKFLMYLIYLIHIIKYGCYQWFLYVIPTYNINSQYCAPLDQFDWFGPVGLARGATKKNNSNNEQSV